MKSHYTFFKKFLAVFLAALFFCLAGISFLGIFFAAEYDFYTSTRGQLRHEFITQLLQKEMYLAFDKYQYGSDPIGYYEDTNFCFEIKDKDGNLLLTNYHGEEVLETISFEVSPTIVYEPIDWNDRFLLTGYVISTEHYTDLFHTELGFVDFLFAMRFILIAIFAVAFICAVCCWVYLLYAAGKRPNEETPRCSIIEKIPFDIYCLAYVLLVCLAILLCDFIQYSIPEVMFLMGVALIVLVAYLLMLAFCVSLAIRIKTKTLFKNTAVYIVCSFLVRKIKALFRIVPLVWKTIIVFTLNLLLDIFLILLFRDASCFFILFKSLFFLPVLAYIAYSFRKLRKGAEEIEKGGLDHHIDTTNMLMEFKSFGETLNNIGGGLTKAVDERMKSERMKTELITNVSHDIKTPLTSIINYADLLKKEDIQNETAVGYIEVIDRQASRLKKLITDLVEASKASTGNIQVNLEKLDICVLLQQAAGEYDEKFRSAELIPVLRLPENPIAISADGRLLWRVFDNLLGNICKYSLPGTRVYLNAAAYGNMCIISFKNISRTELNVSPDELVERFVRADSSRSTEGNGLGLSIAQSIVDLQGGKLEITADGDLFKVNLQFPMLT